MRSNERFVHPLLTDPVAFKVPVGIKISFKNSSGDFFRNEILSGDDENVSGDLKNFRHILELV